MASASGERGYEESAVNITNTTTHTLITGSDTADTINNRAKANYVTIDSGGGNDSIKAGEEVGHEAASLKANHVSINAGSGDDYIYSAGEYNTIVAGEGNDTIIGGSRHLINAGEGNDWVDIGYGVVTAYGGAGNDTIVAGYSNQVYVNGGEGDDYLANTGGYRGLTPITLEGGTGGDTISLVKEKYSVGINGRAVIKYKSGDGDDTILNATSLSTLAITDDADYYTVKSGADVVVNVGEGAVTFKDAKGRLVNVITTEQNPKVYHTRRQCGR